jgi:hypothetical protein
MSLKPLECLRAVVNCGHWHAQDSPCHSKAISPMAMSLLATACDGTLATTAQLTSVRVVCNNTLAVALGHGAGQGAVKVPHSTTFDPVAVKKELGLSLSDWEMFKSQLTALSGRKVKAKEAERYLVQVFSDPYAPKDAPPVNERAIKRTLTLFEGTWTRLTLAISTEVPPLGF